MAAAPFMTGQGPVGPCRKGFQNSFSVSEMMMKVRAQMTGQPIALHEAGQAMMDYKESLAIIGLRLDNNVRVPATGEFDGGAFNAQAGNPASRRWVFKDSVSRREAIVVDVLAIKVAPVEVCQIPPKAAAGSAGGGGGSGGGGDGDDGEEGEGAQPLLVVRYSDVRRGGITPAHNASYTDLMRASVSGADEDAASVEGTERGREGGTEKGMEGFLPTVLKEHSTAGSRIEAVICSPQELAIIFRFLETNANLIGAKTLGAWRGASKHNRGGKASNKKVKAGGKKEKVGASSSSGGGGAVGGGLFTLSFIVPPTNGNSKVAEGENICAVCKRSCTLSCSRCKTAHYCSREHQREHWKKHKHVCGKSAEELSEGRLSSGGSSGGGGAGAGNGDRDSVLVPVVDPKMAAEGRVMMNMGHGSMAQDGSMNTSRGAKETTVNMKDKMRNVHGDATFLVKCQVPMMGVVGGAAGLMCYDERRSFTTIIAGDSAAGMRLAALIRSDHRHSVRRVKGYFEATMEGAVLRIFVDDLAEPQVW